MNRRRWAIRLYWGGALLNEMAQTRTHAGAVHRLHRHERRYMVVPGFWTIERLP
jgi:hypothetical protein